MICEHSNTGLLTVQVDETGLMLSENLSGVLLTLHRQDNELKNFEFIDSILLGEDGDSLNDLIKERFIVLEDGIWQLTAKGRAYVDVVILTKKSRLYSALIPFACALSFVLAILSLIA